MFQPIQFPNLTGLKGLSDQLLADHLKLYQGYVENANKVVEALKTAEAPVKAGLLRQYSFEFNGMRLHEAYFRALGGVAFKIATASRLETLMKQSFGSVAAWKKDFESIATTRGNGWALLWYDPETKQLFNVWVDQHHVGLPAVGQALVVFDLWEHAYLKDYGIDRSGYVKAFFDNFSWHMADQLVQFDIHDQVS